MRGAEISADVLFSRKGTMTEKRERFERIVEKRVQNVTESLRKLGNCSNPYAYEYDDEDVEKIFTTVKASLSEVEEQFEKVLTKKSAKTREEDEEEEE